MNDEEIDLLFPNYEDYEDYDCVSCTLKHWPELWPIEMYANSSVRGLTLATCSGSHPTSKSHALQVSALSQLCEEQGWQLLETLPDGREIYKVRP